MTTKPDRLERVVQGINYKECLLLVELQVAEKWNVINAITNG
jgi:hypothetical protein